MATDALLRWVSSSHGSVPVRRSTLAPPPDEEEALDALWLTLTGHDDEESVVDVTRDLAHALDESGAKLESATLHMTRCIERGETDRIAPLLRAHRQSVERMRELVLDLLDATASAVPRVAVEAVDIPSAVQAASSMLRDRLRLAALRVVVPARVPMVQGREHEVVQALLGVLDHALQATGGSGPIELEVVVTPEHVAVRVSDRALGSSRLERGIALCGVAQATQRVGGSLAIEDRDEAGSCVTLRWHRR